MQAVPPGASACRLLGNTFFLYAFSSSLLRYTLLKMTDRNLEEAIFQLQKLNTENGVKQLVEEAAQLFANGRHIEAGALMEKAEAMMATDKGQLVHSKPSTAAASPPDRPKLE